VLTPDERNFQVRCDDVSRSLLYTDPIRSADGTVVPDGTMVTFAVDRSTVSLLSPDADPTRPGLQRPTLRGRARVVFRVPPTAGCTPHLDVQFTATIAGSCAGAMTVRLMQDVTNERFRYVA